MDDLAIARAVHVLAVVIWIGGVAMVTTIILPMARRDRTSTLGRAVLETVERRFIWQARVATLLVAVSGFYMAARLDLWNRFRMIDFWWMHAMVLLWLVFTFILFIAEPLISARSKYSRNEPPEIPAARLRLMQWLHWALLGLSAVTVLAAVAGSHGMLLLP